MRSGFTSDSCGHVDTKGTGICTCDRWPHIVKFGLATEILSWLSYNGYYVYDEYCKYPHIIWTEADVVNVVLYFVIDGCCNMVTIFVYRVVTHCISKILINGKVVYLKCWSLAPKPVFQRYINFSLIVWFVSAVFQRYVVFIHLIFHNYSSRPTLLNMVVQLV